MPGNVADLRLHGRVLDQIRNVTFSATLMKIGRLDDVSPWRASAQNGVLGENTQAGRQPPPSIRTNNGDTVRRR